MKILMLDQSIGFDPKDREARPLGTAQRAFIALAEALVARGQQVEARRNGGIDRDMHGVAWRQLDAELPPFGGDAVDTVIVWRDPALLSHASVPAGAQALRFGWKERVLVEAQSSCLIGKGSGITRFRLVALGGQVGFSLVVCFRKLVRNSSSFSSKSCVCGKT